MTENPYLKAQRLAERVGNGFVYTLAVLAVLAALAAVVKVCLDSGWGWWTLALVPGIPAGLAAIMLIVALFWAAVDVVGTRWRAASRDWDAKRAPSSVATDRSPE